MHNHMHSCVQYTAGFVYTARLDTHMYLCQESKWRKGGREGGERNAGGIRVGTLYKQT